MDDDDDRVPFAWGDVGAIVLAAGVAGLTLWLIGDMLLGGNPLEAYFRGPPAPVAAAPTAEELRATPMHLAPGEVRIMLPSKPKPAPVKPKP